eukprot:gene3657-9936_t
MAAGTPSAPPTSPPAARRLWWHGLTGAWSQQEQQCFE